MIHAFAEMMEEVIVIPAQAGIQVLKSVSHL